FQSALIAAFFLTRSLLKSRPAATVSIRFDRGLLPHSNPSPPKKRRGFVSIRFDRGLFPPQVYSPLNSSCVGFQSALIAAFFLTGNSCEITDARLRFNPL